MTRAAFRQADLARAIRAYREATGQMPVVKVAGGVAILTDKGEETPSAGGNTCDSLFGVQSCD